MNIFIIIILIILITIITSVFLCNYIIQKELQKNINKNKAQIGSRFIPKYIYQTIEDKDNINEKFKNNIEYIKKLNPNWKYKLYDDKDILDFIKKYYNPYILKLYLDINPEYGAARADFFRYLLMYIKGGVYLDIKSSMKVPLDKIIREDDEYILSYFGFYVPHKKIVGNKYRELQQWHIICRPKHPFLYAVIKGVINNILYYNNNAIGKIGVLQTTGPVIYTNSILPILSKHKHTLYYNNNYIGLKYSIFSIFSTHENKIGKKKHYSKLTSPIIIRK